MKEELKKYAVTAKCGHVGKGKYIPITFAVNANNSKEAAAKVRLYARVKHDHKDAIISVVEISFEEFKNLRDINSKNPYLFSKNVQEQRIYCDDLSFYLMDEESKNDYKKSNKRDTLEFRRKKQKICLDSILSIKKYEMEMVC